MKDLQKHKWYLITSIVLFSFFSIYYFGYWKNDLGQSEYQRLELKFQSFQEESNTLLENFAKHKKIESFFKQQVDKPHSVLILQEDSLVYWSNNSVNLPDSFKNQIKNGVYFIENGWYSVQVQHKEPYTFIGFVLIKTKYPYENKDLVNSFFEGYDFPYHTEISTSQYGDGKIHGINGEVAFYIHPSKFKDHNKYLEFFSLSSLVIAILLGLYVFVKILIGISPNRTALIVICSQVILIAIRIAGLFVMEREFVEDFELSNPKLFGSNWLMPSLTSAIVNILIIGYIAISTHYLIKVKIFVKNDWANLFILPLYIVLLSLALFINYCIECFVLDSSIPFSIDHLFSLNFYSFVIIALIFILLFSFFLLTRITIKIISQLHVPLNKLMAGAFITSALYISAYFYLGFESIYGCFWPLILIAIIYLLERKLDGKIRFGMGVVILIIISGYTSTSLLTNYEKKELNNRKTFAKKLNSDEDPITEIEYSIIGSNIKTDRFLQSLIDHPYSIPKSNFDQKLRKIYFKDHWDQYEISFYLFDYDSIPIINYRSAKGSDLKSLNDIIDKHTTVSEFSKNIYFVNDYYDKLSYVVRQEIVDEQKGITGYLYCLLKSKKIPEEIGFPSLLINSEDQLITEIQNYSMARYVNSKLIRKYGTYNYPLTAVSWMQKEEQNHVIDGEFDHFVLSTDDGNAIVLTKFKTTFLGFITTFSYLFAIFGLLLLIPLIISNYQSKKQLQALSLTSKIQFVLLFFILVALLSFGFGSGAFIKKQYLSNSKDFIREKIGSVQTEVRQKLGDEENLQNPDLESYLEYILNKFSKVFVTDINLYATDGELLASSRPEIYNIGLISTRMHTDAFANMEIHEKSEFIHQESIGNLSYLSAYQPFRNKDGKILAYLNLQYFAQQNALEDQISDFLVSIINVFILLLAASIILAIFITSWLTRPLKLIQQNISSVQLGRSNTPIEYSGNDEVGSLVEAYNAKVAELEENAQQLAKSERESAWREMAKQVAHEIKNPLTPMKLSVQHFERSFDPNDPDAKERLERLSKSIIEQIDGLTKIANEFSNFAKMPKANEEVLNLNEVIDTCVNLFNQSENCRIVWNKNVSNPIVLADKDLLIRVFNNLLKNAVQAIPKEREGNIVIDLSHNEKKFLIAISDNGSGIPEYLKDKIFVPNFTTKSTGTGLGLAMVKQIVEQARGTVHFTTTPEIGSTFYITLPQYFVEED